jgi:hypothetical protein
VACYGVGLTDASTDNLYRLDYSTLKVGAAAPTTNLDVAYDATGNITTRSDVGAYDYSSPQSGCTDVRALMPIRRLVTAPMLTWQLHEPQAVAPADLAVQIARSPRPLRC